MLNKKPLRANEIVSFRLTSGEEIVGKFVSEDADSVTISRPISIGIQMVGQGQASIAFMPFMASVDDAGQLTFYSRNMVTAPTASRDDVRSSYVKATTGLDLPPTNGASSILKP